MREQKRRTSPTSTLEGLWELCASTLVTQMISFVVYVYSTVLLLVAHGNCNAVNKFIYSWVNFFCTYIVRIKSQSSLLTATTVYVHMWFHLLQEHSISSALHFSRQYRVVPPLSVPALPPPSQGHLPCIRETMVGYSGIDTCVLLVYNQLVFARSLG